MSVEISKDSELLLEGVNLLANPVKSTLGAKGRTVLIKKDYGLVHPTKDGVTVARSIVLEENSVQSASANMLKAAAIRTAEEAGDGTTTTTVLAQKIYSLALDKIKDGAEPVNLKEGIEHAVKKVISFIKEESLIISDDLSQLESIATISANNDKELGNLILEAFKEVGKEGVITHKESATSESFIEFKEGISFDSGFLSNYFVNDPRKYHCSLSNARILLIDGDLEIVEPIIQLIEASINKEEPLVIIANKLSMNVINTLAANVERTPAQLLAVRAPYTGDRRKDFLNDLSFVTGAKIVTDPSGAGFENYNWEHLGGCQRIISKRFSTEIVGGYGDPKEIEGRVEDLRKLLSNTKDKDDKEFIKERISKLNGGVAILNVGANTTVELTEKMDRVEDALAATKSALEEGVVSGGGLTLFRASSYLKSNRTPRKYKIGYEVVSEALREPLLQILRNAGITEKEEQKIVDQIEQGGYSQGYDVKAGKLVEMISSGIIDPAKVCRIAIEAASSVVNLLITTSYTIINKK